MASNLILAEDTRTGVVAQVPAHYLEHPTFGEFLKEVRNSKTRVRLFEPAVDTETDGQESAESETKEDEAPVKASPATIKKGSN